MKSEKSFVSQLQNNVYVDFQDARKRILLVEDSPIMQKELQLYYKQLGCGSIDLAQDGTQALECYQKDYYDFVSMDIIMPEMHGMECFLRLHEIDPRMKALFISSLSYEHLSQTAVFTQEQYCAYYVSKPVKLHDLREAVLRILSLSTRESSNIYPHGASSPQLRKQAKG